MLCGMSNTRKTKPPAAVRRQASFSNLAPSVKMALSAVVVVTPDVAPWFVIAACSEKY